MRLFSFVIALGLAAILAAGLAAGASAPAPVAVPVEKSAAPKSASATPAAPGATPAEPEPPDDFQTLSLTDLQRRVLEQVFHRHPFESPAAPAPQARVRIKAEPVAPGGLCRMGPEGDLPVQLTVTVLLAGTAAPVRLRYYAEDFYGRKVAEGTMPNVFPDAGGTATADLVLKEHTTYGYYHILVTATAEEQTATAACGVAVVHAVGEGPDTKGPFGVAAPMGSDLGNLPEICRRLGAAHLSFYWDDGRAVALHAVPGRSPESRWDEGEATLKPVAAAGLAPAGIVLVEPPHDSAVPPALVEAQAEAVAHYAASAKEWQLAPAFCLGGGPYEPHGRLGHDEAGTHIFTSSSIAASVAAYRLSVTGLLEAVRRTQAPVSLSVAAAPEDLVDLLTEGPVLAGADAVSLWLNADASAPNLRSGAFRRSLDYSREVARRAGIKRIIVGETGEDPLAATPQQQAWKLVTRHVLALAGGAERVYVGYGRGVPTPLPSAAAYAWMTHLLGGTRYREDLWPDTPLVQAHLFAGAERRVAVIWSWAGEDPATPDRGAIVFDEGSRLEAFDVVGHSVGIWKGERLIVPLGEAPVYIVSADLSADQLRDRIRRAKIFGIAPATLWFRNLAAGDQPGRMTATLWVQNQRPYRAEVMAGLLVPEGWRSRQSKHQFALDPGQAREVAFDLDVPVDLGPPPYAIQAAATVNEELARRTPSVWPALIPEKTIEVGYGLDDWQGIEPVVVTSVAGDVKAEVRAAWDAKFFYFSAVVHRDRAGFRTGRFASDGDAVQLAWGLADRADDDFGQRGRDRAYPIGAFRDTDHLMAVTFGKEGAQVLRLRGLRQALRDHVPGNQDSWYGPVDGAQADISRDEEKKVTIFEAAVPLSALAPLRGERGRTLRFGFRIGDGQRPPLEWARAAAVPDFLAGPGSFLPISYAEGLPCQTVWTISGPPAAPKKP
ncbi:MAG: hypothetical protein NTY65_01940 [Planctomycetota bacterium]|nr:hypothetical protein [Planctomycetota bacterium]